MSYLDSGFDNNLIRNDYPDTESVADSSLISEILTAGALPISAVSNALVSAEALDAQAKQILGDFSFGASGAISIITDADNGLWISPTGILAKKAGVNTFAIEIDGDATFGGNLVAATGTLGALTIASGGNIKLGKTAYTDDTNAGFFLGDVSGVSKLNIGSSATKYLHYDGTDITMLGGTLIGNYKTKTPASGVGSSVVITGGTNEMIHFYYEATETATIKGYTTEGSEITYLDIAAASGRHIRLKNSNIEIDGDLLPHEDENHNCGQSGTKWNNIYAQVLWQADSTDGSRHCYDFAYIEKGLISEKLLKTVAKKNKGLSNTNGFIPKLKLPFKQGTVLKWTGKGLKENEKESDFAIAIASEKGLPIVLGAEPVRVIGKAKIGDFIIPSNKKGCAMACRYEGLAEPIGRCLENKNDTKERLIKVMIKF